MYSLIYYSISNTSSIFSYIWIQLLTLTDPLHGQPLAYALPRLANRRAV